MSASVMHSAPIYAAFGRMHSVEELDSSLTLLSRHNVLGQRTMPITPPGTPVAQSPAEQHFEYSPDSPSDPIPPNTPVTPGLGPLRVSTERPGVSTNSNGAPMPNIDNKIEQAMDLVKTHLTFAVREEIEVLRQTIVELEQKVHQVESENQLLRQYAPVEVVSNLSALVAQQKAQAGPSSTSASSAAATASSIAASKIAPSSFCSTAFANTLNNVVADVRQQIRNPNPQ